MFNNCCKYDCFMNTVFGATHLCQEVLEEKSSPLVDEKN